MTINNDGFVSFPIHTLPDSIGQFISEGAQSLSCDETYLALPAISLAAGIIGTTYRTKVRCDWKTFPIIWAAFVGESGTAKSPALKLMQAPLDNYENEASLRRLADQAARRRAKLEEKKRSASPPGDLPDVPVRSNRKRSRPTLGNESRILISDTTIEALISVIDKNPSGLVVVRDELSGWVQSMNKYSPGKNSGEEAHWLSMYNGSSITLDRKTGRQKHIHIPTAAVSICGGIQPAVLQSCLTNQHFASGFASRILMAFPPRKEKKWRDEGVPSTISDRYSGTFARLIGLRNKAGRTTTDIALDKESLILFQNYYEDHNAEGTNLQGTLASAWSKLEETPARVALILELLCWAERNNPGLPNPTISGNSMRNAIQIANWFKEESKRIYGKLFSTQQVDLTAKVIAFTEGNGGKCSIRELQQNISHFKRLGSCETRSFVDGLVRTGYGTWKPTNTEGPGPTGELFVLQSTGIPNRLNSLSTSIPSPSGDITRPVHDQSPYNHQQTTSTVSLTAAN